MTSVKWNGREVGNPVLRFLVTLWVALGMMLAVTMMMLSIIAIIVLFPVWVPLDYALRHIGRHGFIRFSPDGRHFSLIFNLEAFRS